MLDGERFPTVDHLFIGLLVNAAPLVVATHSRSGSRARPFDRFAGPEPPSNASLFGFEEDGEGGGRAGGRAMESNVLT